MKLQLYGYAAVWHVEGDAGTEYILADGTVERFAMTAFDRALTRGCDVRADLLHNGELRLGYIGDGTVRLSVDAVGLRYEIDLSNELAELVRQMVAARTLRGASVRFREREAREYVERGRRVLEHTDVRLEAFSPVRYPAYTATTCAVRGAAFEPEEGEQI